MVLWLVDFDAEALYGARHGGRNEDHTNQRNGYRDRRWETSAVSVPLRIPKLRPDSYFPGALEPRWGAGTVITARTGGVNPSSRDSLNRRVGQSNADAL